MAKFKKLHIGDNVASGGGRVFKKLSTESAAEDSIVGTWVFNGHPSTEYMTNWFSVEFTSNNENFIAMSDKRSQTSSIHDGNLKYFKTANSYVTVINGGTEEWIEGYKTITILTEPTNAEFIAWLKANATKQNAPSLITFNIEGTTYQAEEGMLWWEWAESDYDTDGFMLADKVYFPNGVDYISGVTPYDEIINDGSYYKYSGPHSGGSNE